MVHRKAKTAGPAVAPEVLAGACVASAEKAAPAQAPSLPPRPIMQARDRSGHGTRPFPDADLCNHPGCTQRSWHARGDEKPSRCAAHKDPDMVQFFSKACQRVGCYTRPSYTTQGESRPRFCAEHHLPGMVNTRSRRCVHEGCLTQPLFGAEGDLRPTLCGAHREPHMVNLVNKRCQHPEGCPKLSGFAAVGEKTARFCSSHKEEGMVCTIEKRSAKKAKAK
ncbi:MAG: hypothetical protein WDW36_001385 [Sanguina aurantia]